MARSRRPSPLGSAARNRTAPAQGLRPHGYRGHSQRPQGVRAPWTVTLSAEFTPDAELGEAVCNESSAGREHWVGKLSDSKKTEVQVSPEILAKYAGIYEEQDFWGTGSHPRIIEVTVSDGKLIATLGDEGRQSWWLSRKPYSRAFGAWGISFVTDSQGIHTHLLEMHVSGNYKYQRKN